MVARFRVREAAKNGVWVQWRRRWIRFSRQATQIVVEIAFRHVMESERPNSGSWLQFPGMCDYVQTGVAEFSGCREHDAADGGLFNLVGVRMRVTVGMPNRQ